MSKDTKAQEGGRDLLAPPASMAQQRVHTENVEDGADTSRNLIPTDGKAAQQDSDLKAVVARPESA